MKDEEMAEEYAKPLDVKYGGSFVRTTEEVKQAFLTNYSFYFSIYSLIHYIIRNYNRVPLYLIAFCTPPPICSIL